MYMNNLSYLLVTIAAFLFLSLASCNDSGDDPVRQGRSISPDHTVTIYDGDNSVTEVHVAIADSESERNEGLMDVHEMAFDTGMLFLFDDEQPRSFWMANTPLSLDIIFMNANREIIRIRTNTTPYSERQVTSEVPAQFVLEVNAGFVREYDLREGMRMEWE